MLIIIKNESIVKKLNSYSTQLNILNFLDKKFMG